MLNQTKWFWVHSLTSWYAIVAISVVWYVFVTKTLVLVSVHISETVHHNFRSEISKTLLFYYYLFINLILRPKCSETGRLKSQTNKDKLPCTLFLLFALSVALLICHNLNRLHTCFTEYIFLLNGFLWPQFEIYYIYFRYCWPLFFFSQQ